jgi:hypothetical protein
MNMNDARSFRASLLAALAGLIVCAASAFAEPSRGPRISLPEPVFDFGQVREGSVLEHVFEIRNAGTEVLLLRQVRPS